MQFKENKKWFNSFNMETAMCNENDPSMFKVTSSTL